MSISKLYIAPGLLKDHAKSMKVDIEEAEKDLVARVYQITAIYEKEGSNLYYWDRRDRTALNAIFQNHLVDREMKRAMLKDLATCDEVLTPLKDMLKFTLQCESRARFLVKIANTLQRLSESDLAFFVDCVNTLKTWSLGGRPESPKQKHDYLLECLDVCESSVPEKISKEVHKEFIADRMEKLIKLGEKIKRGEKI